LDQHNPFDTLINFKYPPGNPTRNATYFFEARERSMENGIPNKEKMAISHSTLIVGNIEAEEHLIINGTVEGKIKINNYTLFIGPRGRLKGEVHAQNVRIRGRMRRAINAMGKVEITREANFSGKIKSKGISVEKGAYFEASVELG
jgi:cytoskeletal protein CcmA (bactofilin family)